MKAVDEPSSQVRVFGVRHHGPGSARSLLRALRSWQPDALLVEGPPDADELLPLAGSPEMEPPVALLAYVPDTPRQASFFPFARFSPEWQAIRFGLERGLPVRFMDLPQRHWLALRQAEAGGQGPAVQEPPLDRLARAAGYEDGDYWWGLLVEERGADEAVFAAILELMAALRGDVEKEPGSAEYQAWVDPLGPLREAAMRSIIRSAQQEGHRRMAVVCGAWHAPALVNMPPAREDTAMIRGLDRVKVNVTWVPWTYGHLARASGYGAGISSPGWYEHLWTTPQQTTARWLGRVAHLLRQEDIDASAAQVIDAVRLAEALAAVRELARPGLRELGEATLAVFCFGNPLPLQVIQRQLVVGDRLGQVPPEAPAVPLQRDLVAAQRRWRLPPEPGPRTYDLDLRRPFGLPRSHLLHRLLLLGVPWGKLERAAQARGTFHEIWTLQWEPAFAVTLVEAAMWGNTVAEAAANLACHQADTAPSLAVLTALLERVILADLPVAVDPVVARLQSAAALTSDVAGLMDALPPLGRTLRYGSVRQEAGQAALDTANLAAVIDGLVTRICIGLPLACASLDDDAAREMLGRLEATDGILAIIQQPALSELWQRTLVRLADQDGLHGLLAGRCCRLLLDREAFAAAEVARRLGLALSPAADPLQAAAWLEGLLRGSGLLLLHDENLWTILDDWLVALSEGAFTTVLPLLRRTFSAFPAPERRRMGERVRRGPAGLAARAAGVAGVDAERADAVLPLLARLLGLEED